MQMPVHVQWSDHQLFSNWAATMEKQAARCKPLRGCAFVPKPEKEAALTCHANEWKYKHNNIRGGEKKTNNTHDKYSSCTRSVICAENVANTKIIPKYRMPNFPKTIIPISDFETSTLLHDHSVFHKINANGTSVLFHKLVPHANCR